VTTRRPFLQSGALVGCGVRPRQIKAEARRIDGRHCADPGSQGSEIGGVLLSVWLSRCVQYGVESRKAPLTRF
jgi:hypothetical protein